MLMGRVVGNIVSTRKYDSLVGSKILEIRIVENKKETDKYIIAVDNGIGAGIGENVLIVTGSGARLAHGDGTTPIDAAVVGIID